MMRRNKVQRTAKGVTKDAKKAPKKKGFISRSISQAVMLSVISAGVKYFTDSKLGSARRRKVKSLVGGKG